MNDPTFRLILVIGFALVVPILLYHRIKSQATGESLDRRQEGLFMLIALRLLGLVFFVSLFVYLIEPEWLAWSSVELPTWARWFGVGLLAIAGALVTWTFRHLGKNLTDTVVTRKEHALVTTGPYRWVRHPFYVAFLVGVLGACLATTSWFFGIGGLAFVLLVLRTRKEEAKLVERFGDEYRRYMQQTGRFFPRFFRS